MTHIQQQVSHFVWGRAAQESSSIRVKLSLSVSQSPAGPPKRVLLLFAPTPEDADPGGQVGRSLQADPADLDKVAQWAQTPPPTRRHGRREKQCGRHHLGVTVWMPPTRHHGMRQKQSGRHHLGAGPCITQPTVANMVWNMPPALVLPAVKWLRG